MKDNVDFDKKEGSVYCMCPNCKIARKKIDKKWTIMKRGYERNGCARFFCRSCETWFNEKSGHSMEWYGR